MRVIIAGSRTINSYEEVEKAIEDSGFVIDEVVSGGARGVDKLGEVWARDHDIPIKVFPADWAEYGKAAGIIRNGQMSRYADALIAVWDGSSRGTTDMICKAHHEGLRVHVRTVTTSKETYRGSRRPA